MYYLIKNDIAYLQLDLIEAKCTIFDREDIKIEKNNNDGYDVTAYNRQLYLDKTPVKIAHYTNEWTENEIFDDISIKVLCKRFGYVLTKEVE
jgi:hypothetical protein